MTEPAGRVRAAVTGRGATGAVKASRQSVRRRLDRFSLRVQARVDADWSDRVLPWVLAASLFTVLAGLSVASVRSLHGGDGLGVWLQAGWLVRHGLAPVSTISGANPISGQWSFVAWPALLLTNAVRAPVDLAVLQSAALAVAVVPLWRLAREIAHLRIGATCAVIFAYGLAPTVQATNLSILHPEVVAVPALLTAFLSYRRDQRIGYWVAVAVVLSCRADLGLVVALLGVLMVMEGHRRWGTATVLIGVAWTVAAVLVLRPEIPVGPLNPAQAAAAGGVAPLAALRGLFTDPGQVLSDLFAKDSIDVLVAVFGGLLFLPLVAPRFLMPAVPTLVLGLSGEHAVKRAAGASATIDVASPDRVVVALAFVFIAAVMALERMGKRSVTRVNVDHRLVAALLIAALALFSQDAASSPYERPWTWGTRSAVDRARVTAAHRIGERSVAASPELLSLVAERRLVRSLPIQPLPSDTQIGRGVDAVVLDTTDQSVVGGWTLASRSIARSKLRDEGFHLVYGQAGIYAFVRGVDR